MSAVRRPLAMPLQLLLSPPFFGHRQPMLSPPFKDDLRLGPCITSVVFEDDVRIRVRHLVTVVANFANHLSPF